MGAFEKDNAYTTSPCRETNPMMMMMVMVITDIYDRYTKFDMMVKYVIACPALLSQERTYQSIWVC